MDHRRVLRVAEEDAIEMLTHVLPVDLVVEVEKAKVKVATEGESSRSV
jgi:hypothetical protein